MANARSSAPVLVALLAVLLVFPAESRAADEMDIYIKELPLAQRARLVENYTVAGFNFSKFLKFQRPAAIYLSCTNQPCDPAPLRMLDDLRAKSPLAFGERVGEAGSAQIEIYVAPQPLAYEARDRVVDGKLHTDASYSGRHISSPPNPLPAPCRTATYFNFHTGVIEKSLVFIDSDASPRIQALCMGFELIRAAGVMNSWHVMSHQKLDAEFDDEAARWLAANAYLHGLPEIRPGDTMKKARAALSARYGPEVTSP